MPNTVFEKLSHDENELMKTNGVLGEASKAKGIISKELTVGSKTMPMAFFVVDVKGKCNILVGRDWIHANGSVPSTLHQCVVQWVGDKIEVMKADDSACVALAEAQGNLQEGELKCLTGRDLFDYDYISIGHDGFVPVNVKPMVVNPLEDIGVKK
jgi:hypothetical protein